MNIRSVTLFRRSLIVSFSCLLLACWIIPASLRVRAQDPITNRQRTKGQPALPKKPETSPTPAVVTGTTANPTGEMIAEGVVLITGGRPALTQVRRNGVESGRLSRILDDGRTEEDRYEMKFIRGETADKDRLRVDHKTPQLEYSLVNNNGKVFGIVNGSSFTPRADTSANFVADHVHSIDALLRYKENGSKVTLVRKDKQKGLDFFVIDLVDKDNQQTRYYVSAKTLRVLWLEYEDTPAGARTPIKYEKRFHDYRLAQNGWTPFRIVLVQDGKPILETRILTVTYGVKMEDALFQTPEQASAANP